MKFVFSLGFVLLGDWVDCKVVVRVFFFEEVCYMFDVSSVELYG